MLPRFFLLLIVTQLPGCMTVSRSPTAGPVFRSGWEATITHVGVNAIYSAIFAVANYNIAIALREDFTATKVEAFLVPHPQGYDVVVLSQRPLNHSEEDSVWRIINASYDDARSNRPMYRSKKVTNKALEQTTRLHVIGRFKLCPSVVVAHL